jgi:hypothetical protein
MEKSMGDRAKVASFEDVAAKFEQAVEVFVRDAEAMAKEVDASLKRAKKKSDRLEYLFHLSKTGRTAELEAELFGKPKDVVERPRRAKVSS